MNPFSENFILYKVINLLVDLLHYLNPFSEDFILIKLWDFLVNIISYINPFSDNFLGKKIVELIGDLFNFLFIPEDDYFSNKFNEVKSALIHKLGYDNYIEIFGNLENINEGNINSISLENYKLGSLIINFSNFIDISKISNYRETWFTWVRGVTFILLIIYNFNQIYKLIRGTNLADGMSTISHMSGGADK